MTVGPDKQCSNGCGTLIYWSDENEYNKNLPYDAKNRQQRHKCPNYKKTENFTRTLNKLEEKPIISNDKILDEIKALTELVKKQCQLFEAILINQGLYKPASDLE